MHSSFSAQVRRILGAILILVLVLTMLAACTEDDDKDDTPEPAEPTAITEAEPEDSTPLPADEDEPSGEEEGAPDGDEAAPEEPPLPTEGPEGLSLEEVPLESLRFATRLIGELAGTEEDVPEWDVETVRLGPVVVPYYRFDVEGPAYYEFQVVTGSLDEPQPAGAILISAGQYDFPLVQWNSHGVPISWYLLEQSEGTATTFYKLSQVYFVGETEDGERVAEIGTRIQRISGMQMEWLDEERELNSVRIAPAEVPEDLEADPEEMPEIEYTVEETGPEPYPIEYTAWESWEELKDGYVESHAVLNESVRRVAAQDWEVTGLVQEFGEGLVVDQTRRVMLIFPDAEFELLEGTADVVEVEALERDELPTILEITAQAPGDAHISVTYPEGQQEDIRFFVMAPDEVPDPTTFAAPAESSITLASNTPGQFTAASRQVFWGTWYTTLAGTDADQRNYFQYNLANGCPSGCGATAWGNLIGWADRQAALGHWYWVGRHGLFRQNGGPAPSPNVVAPYSMNTGVKNMIQETGAVIATNCGWTQFNAMWGVYYYLLPRSYATVVTTWNIFGASQGLFEEARDWIIDKDSPTVVGWDAHFNVAYGYHYRFFFVQNAQGVVYPVYVHKEFKVNQGWAPSGTWDLQWMAAYSQFSGLLIPFVGLTDW